MPATRKKHAPVKSMPTAQVFMSGASQAVRKRQRSEGALERRADSIARVRHFPDCAWRAAGHSP